MSLLLAGKDDSKSSYYEDAWCYAKNIGGGVVIGGAAVAAAPVVLSAAGFTAGGIAAGSLAAKAMSVAATANGGGVVAGGVVAALQSAGAAGLGIGAKLGIGTAVGGVYSYFTGGCYKGNCEEEAEET
ncbi:hypothetical protein FSP39_015498 [Pinctada imbricata]|uniref:Uncharacterized protein n=1 Tax=Pinctada imbricata TaxID=66713 RepID=A0AA88YCX8_PINIB|nr:hypothetical protein FSP39_015498 [Pinctada imbricata]